MCERMVVGLRTLLVLLSAGPRGALLQNTPQQVLSPLTQTVNPTPPSKESLLANLPTLSGQISPMNRRSSLKCSKVFIILISFFLSLKLSIVLFLISFFSSFFIFDF